jgi:hypothetical protein
MRRLACVLVPAAAVLAFVLAPPAAPAAEAPFRALSPFDRVGVVYGGPRKIFVTSGDGNSASTTEVFQRPNPGPIPFRIAWPDGAGSFALVEQPTGTPDNRWRLKVIEYVERTVHDITTKLDVLEPGDLHAVIESVRWIGTGSASRILLDLANVGIGSIRPDGSSPVLVDDTWLANPEAAVFASGHKVVYPRLGPDVGQGRHFTDLVIRDLKTGVETPLTDTLDSSEREPVLSPDETKVAYVRGPFQEPETGLKHLQASVYVVDVDGTDAHVVAQAGERRYDEPAWRPDGARIAFMGYKDPIVNEGFEGKAVLYSAKPDGTDLVRHTPLSTPYHTASNVNQPRPSDIAWGRTCQVITSCISLTTFETSGPTSLQSNPDLSQPASIGYYVERYHGRRLKPFGRVPFGEKARGRARVRWNLEIDGRPLPRGRYRITLRALAAGAIPIDRARSVDLIVGRRHRIVLDRTPRVP